MTMVVSLVALAIVAFSATAYAQRAHEGPGDRDAPRPFVHFGMGRFYNPFWDPFYPYGMYPYDMYPGVIEHDTAVNVKGVPKQTEVFVDGYFAGTAGKVRTTPGGHAITLYLPGYRTLTQDVYVAPGSTVKLQETMDKLPGGEASAPPPMPARPMRRVPTGTPRQG
jgi:hypothetical protein